MQAGGAARPTGAMTPRVIRKNANLGSGLGRELSWGEVLRYGAPQPDLPDWLNRWRTGNLKFLQRGARKVFTARALNLPHFYGQVWARVFRSNGAMENYGLISMRVVTDAGVNAIVDAFQNTFELENFKFHGIGTGSTAEGAGETALVTELTTQYDPDSTRATGTTAEGASPNIFQTVGTNAVDASVNLREHGIFDQAATGGGTLLDRSLFNAINLDSGDSIETTYELTVNAGG